ncbi:MBL fold metallo-hydrolase [Cerasicoccus fimbriatus]|uniref:MBL fold metallo-hydrolase n=1 Tax=Cerasicoccus fimbriatus TaxID=3014554 RepID=UPI0022B2D0C0|nr:MBL fold metallo-hydrolase [Cerasicoccus sp. TK19100]
MRFRILGSSSSGNAALLITPQSKVLIDAGFSGRRLREKLAGIGESLESIDAVFITHEHGDHTAGLKALTRLPHLKFFANRDTARAAQAKLDRKVNWGLFETGVGFQFNDLKVHPFAIPHDAHDPVGYVFECGDGSLFSPFRKLAWLTDLGYAPQLVKEHIRDCDMLVLEANYDLELLERCEKRPWSTKQRIRGRHGHLSNEAAFELLAEAANPRWRHICLAHLSKDCNCPNLVHRHFEPLRNGNHNLRIDVFDPSSEIGEEYNLAAGW